MKRYAVSTILAVALLSPPSGAAFAQSNSVPKILPPAQAVPQTPAVPAQKPPFEFAKDLDGLFKQLSRTRDAKLADRISTRIWEKWQTSDSRSIDLLTIWARNASGSRRFNVALDLLDQVIALRPEYAEGFNQRATLHFMMENYGKSIVDIERTLALEPRHYGALAGLAAILERLGEKEQALETWYRVLTIYPAMKSAQDSVVRLEEELAGSGI
jgi:tetratricopeptide (TPR) repeat protein